MSNKKSVPINPVHFFYADKNSIKLSRIIWCFFRNRNIMRV